MSWEYWHYPDNLRKTCHLPWRCFTALYLAFADSRYWIEPPVREAMFSCPPFRHGHLNVACHRPKYFWSYFSEYAEKLEKHIRNLMVGREYIKPDYEGVIFVAGEEEGEYIYDEKMFWSEEEFEQLLLDENGQKISYSEIPNNVSTLAWMQKMYELIGLLTRQVVEVDVKYFGKVGSNRMSQGPYWFGMTPKGAVRHTTFEEEPSTFFPNGVDETYYLSVGHSHSISTIVHHDEEKVVLSGSKADSAPYGRYNCKMYLGRIGIMFDELFNLAVNMVKGAVVAGKLCSVCHSKDAEFWSGIGLTEGVNSFTPPNSGWILRKSTPDSDTGNPPPWAAIEEYGVPEAVDDSFAPGDDEGEVNIERGCEIKKAAVIMDVEPLIPPTWEEYLGWLENGRPYQLKLKEEPSASSGNPEGEYPNDHGLIPKAAGNSIKQKLRPLIKALWSIPNKNPGIRFKVSPEDPQEELDKLDKATTWGELYDPFNNLLSYRCNGDFVSPEFGGNLIDEDTKKLRPAREWNLTDEDLTGLKEIAQDLDEFYFKLANKDIIKQDEAESEAESLVDRFKTEFKRVYERKAESEIIHGESRKGTSSGTGAYYENTLNKAYDAAKGNSVSSYATGEFCSQVVDAAIPMKNDAGYVGPYNVNLEGATVYVLIESNEPIAINDVQFYATYKSEKQFKSTCGANYNELMAVSVDMNDTLIPSVGSPSKYAKASLCDKDNPPPLPSGDAVVTTYYNGDSSWPLKNGEWGANYECRLVDYKIKWDELFS